MARWLSTTLLVLGILMLGTAYWVQAAPGGQSAEEGEALFQQYCAGCHTIGGGDLSGPDLLGVAERRDPEWLEHWLAEPDQMIADGDPIALQLLAQYNNVPMPNQHLSLSEIDALLAYMGVAEAAHPADMQPQAAPAGNARAGKDLFTGAKGFANGGTACIACHDTVALGVPGGGLLGPDLTQSAQRYGGEAGLTGVLGTIAFPSMVPIYRDRPLAPQEQVDLAAFLAQTAGEDAPGRGPRHAVLYLLAFGAMDVFLVGLFLWHRRLPRAGRRLSARR